MPTNVDEWVDRLTQLTEEMDAKTISSAQQSNKSAVAIVEAWALEMQAAAMFLATYSGAVQVDVEALVEMANTIIDTVQAILIAMGIALLLKKLRKSKSKKVPFEYVVTLNTYKKDLGRKTKPVPQSKSTLDRAAEAAYLTLRVEWSTHHMLTIMKALQLQAGYRPGSKELIWKANMDSATCSVCRFMHNKKSINGDFLPVILKKFPSYKAYVNWMGFPHAHPRCRCVAVLSK